MKYTELDDAKNGLPSLPPLQAVSTAAMFAVHAIEQLQICFWSSAFDLDSAEQVENRLTLRREWLGRWIPQLAADLERLDNYLQPTEVWDQLCLANPYPVKLPSQKAIHANEERISRDRIVGENYVDGVFDHGSQLLNMITIATATDRRWLEDSAGIVVPDPTAVFENWAHAKLAVEGLLVDCPRLRLHLKKEYQRATQEQLRDLEEWTTMPIRKVARMLKISSDTVYRRIQDGVLRANKIKGSHDYSFCLRDLEKLGA